jgi:hypothetical protein
MIVEFTPSVIAGLLFTAVALVVWGLIVIKNPSL